MQTKAHRTQNQLKHLEADASHAMSEEKLLELVHRMKELIEARGDRLLQEAQAYYDSKVKLFDTEYRYSG